MVPALAILAGASLFVKFSVGLFTIGLTIIVAARTSRWKRDALLAIGAFVLSIGLIWTTTGNSLGDLPLYLRMSAALAAGYAGAMSSEGGGAISWCGAVIVLISFFYSLRLALRPTNAPMTGFCNMVAFLFFAWIALKEGFVRHDDLHDVDFFGLMMIAIVASPWTPSNVPSRLCPDASRRENLGILGLTVLLGCDVAGFVVPDPARTVSNVHGLASQVTTFLSPSRRAQTIQLARLTLQAAYNLPASFAYKSAAKPLPWSLAETLSPGHFLASDGLSLHTENTAPTSLPWTNSTHHSSARGPCEYVSYSRFFKTKTFSIDPLLASQRNSRAYVPV